MATKSSSLSENKRRGLVSRIVHDIGACSDLIISAVTVTIPLLLLSAVLLGLIFYYRVDTRTVSMSFNTPSNRTHGDDAYLVNFDATKLTAVADWCSTVAGALPACFMGLWSYRYVALLKKMSDKTEISHLPSPFQINLFLDLQSGSMTSLYTGLRYVFSHRREHQLRYFYSILTVISVLGYGIYATDTWLHTTTITVSVYQFTPVAQPVFKYGRGLPSNCTTGSLDYKDCTMDLVPTRGDYLVAPVEMFQTLNNVSVNNRVLTATVEGQRMSYLAPAYPFPDTVYSTSTLAASSSCELITKQCFQTEGAEALSKFDCSSHFNYNTSTVSTGSTSSRPFTVGYFQDSKWTIPMNTSAPSNPSFTVFDMSLTQTQYISPSIGDQLANDDYGDHSFIVSCNSTLYHLNYTFNPMAGILTEASYSLITNPKAIQGIVETDQLGYCDSYIYNGAILSYFQDTQDEFMQMFGDYYNAAFLAPAASVAEQVPDSDEQVISTLLVARVPKAPLYALIACCLLSAAYGGLITVYACLSHPLALSQYHLQLSTQGVLASLFEGEPAAHPGEAEGPDDLFSEQASQGSVPDAPITRVGIVSAPETATGLKFRTYATEMKTIAPSQQQKDTKHLGHAGSIKYERVPEDRAED